MVTEKMIEALKPCPFCGVDLYACTYDGGKERYAHEANDCVLARKFVQGEKAEKLWNRRAEAALSTDAEPVGEGWLYDQECGNAFKSYWKTIFIDREPGPMRGLRNIRKVYAAPPARSADSLPDVGQWTDDDRARAWRDAFDTMHQRAMKAEAALSALAKDRYEKVFDGWKEDWK